MDPALFAKLHFEMVAGSKKESALPEEVRYWLDETVKPLVELEKLDYQNDLVPFSQFESEMKRMAEETALQVYEQIARAQKVLEEAFVEEEKKGEIGHDATFAAWEECRQKLAEKLSDREALAKEEKKLEYLQQTMKVPQAFMDRVYNYGIKCIQEKRFDVALDIFYFLSFLNGKVFEFWLGRATCLQAQEMWQEALDLYLGCLAFESDYPLLFLRISECYAQLNKSQESLEALKLCIQAAGDVPEYAELKMDAEVRMPKAA